MGNILGCCHDYILQKIYYHLMLWNLGSNQSLTSTKLKKKLKKLKKYFGYNGLATPAPRPARDWQLGFSTLPTETQLTRAAPRLRLGLARVHSSGRQKILALLKLFLIISPFSCSDFKLFFNQTSFSYFLLTKLWCLCPCFVSTRREQYINFLI